MEKVTNGLLMHLEALLKPLAGLGNVHTNIATGRNLTRIQAALKEPRDLIKSDADMAAFVKNQDYAVMSSGFDPDKYDESSKAEKGTPEIEYYERYKPYVDFLDSLEEGQLERGAEKINAMLTDEVNGFEPYHYNEEKMSNDFGSPDLNAKMAAVFLIIEGE
jgi:hypothetical protein